VGAPVKVDEAAAVGGLFDAVIDGPDFSFGKARELPRPEPAESPGLFWKATLFSIGEPGLDLLDGAPAGDSGEAAIHGCSTDRRLVLGQDCKALKLQSSSILFGVDSDLLDVHREWAEVGS